MARGEAPDSEAISLLLLVVSQVLLAGGRLGVQQDFQPQEEYEPDPGPDPDLDEMRLRLAVLLEGVDAYTEVFDPYVDPPETVSSLISDDLTSIAAALAHGLRHYSAGRVAEALWWWQFSYVATWGAEASAVLRARAVGGRPRPARHRVRERAGRRGPGCTDAGHGRPGPLTHAGRIRGVLSVPRSSRSAGGHCRAEVRRFLRRRRRGREAGRPADRRRQAGRPRGRGRGLRDG